MVIGYKIKWFKQMILKSWYTDILVHEKLVHIHIYN